MSSIARPVARSVSRSVLAGQGVDLGYLIRSMFSSGEQGFAYDPNDLSTMFQDAAGTVPVTGVGQPAGLILDKSKGLVLGSERVVNGDFSNGSANWNVSGADATHIVTFADGKLRYQSDTTSPILSINQGSIIVAGKWYEVTVTCSDYISGSLKIDGGNGSVVVANGLGTFKSKFIAPSNTFVLVRNSANVDLTIDSISVREISGNHAYQSTSASRPILRKNAVTGANYLEFDGSDDFLTVSKTNMKFLHNGSGASTFAGYTPLSSVYHTIINTGNLGSPTPIGAVIAQDDRVGNGNILNIISNGSGALHVNTVVATGISNASRVVTVKNITGSHIVRCNAVQLLSTSTETGVASQNESTNDLWIGRAPAGLPLNGRIYSLIGIGRLTTGSETTALEKELAKRLGVTLNV